MDWNARARREVVAILAEIDAVGPNVSYDYLVSLMAIAWLQGVNLGSHETLGMVETSFGRLAAEL